MKNMQQMMEQAQQMQKQMQERLEKTVVNASAGGEMVSVTMNGNKQLLSIDIEQEVLAGDDREMLQDLIIAAVNEAARKIDEVMKNQLGNLTADLKIPGLF